MAEILFGDFETRSPVDLKKSGADVYARHPQTRAMAFGYAFDEDKVSVIPIGQKPSQAIIEHVAQGKPFVAHNASFEWLIWNCVYRREFPDLPQLKSSQLICTMAMSYAMSLPGSLEKAAPAAGIATKKDMQGKRIMLQLASPLANGNFHEPDQVPEKFAQMYEYCVQDVEVERDLYKRLIKLSLKEKAVWQLDHKINQRGVSVDMVAVKNAIEIVELEKARLNEEMRLVTENAVATCTANAQLTTWLTFRGIKTEGVAKNNVEDLLSDPNLPADCRKALELRQESAKSSNAKLPAIVSGVCPDGRIRGLYQYWGAGTGRWTGRRVQFQNLPRPKLKQDQIEDIFSILKSVHEP